MNLPENCKIVVAKTPTTTNSAITGDYVSLKNCKRAWIIVLLTQAAGHATGIDPTQASAVAGTGVKALANACRIWANEDITTDTLVRKTDAVTYNVAADVTNKLVIFEIDPAILDHANGFDCLGVGVDASSQATNIASILYVLEMRYQSDSPPAAITD